MKPELAAILACVALGPGCGYLHGFLHPPDPLPTVPGPESPELVRSTRLQLVEVRNDGRFTLRKLSDGSVTELGKRYCELSGPDREGCVVYLATEGSRRSTRVWIDTADPSPPVQAFPLGPGERHFSIGRFELSPVGGRLAFISTRATGVEALELLEVSTGSVRTLRSASCSDLAWFPDGKRLLFTEFGEDNSRSMHIVDCESGALVGTWNLVTSLNGLWVGPDGKDVYSATGDDNALWRLDLATGQHGSWSLPGLVNPIAFGSDRKVVGYALPTVGSKQEFTWSPWNAPSPKYAIKLFDLDTGASCTVAPQKGWLDWIAAVEVGE